MGAVAGVQLVARLVRGLKVAGAIRDIGVLGAASLVWHCQPCWLRVDIRSRSTSATVQAESSDGSSWVG
ncbi:hypothetical protein ACFSC4_05480 [Deinococcus malanensis]|uniref:hypothetical protein n=1 Tax=Deinococcus malanensis TaxID=1706855 RepID=UPI00363D2A65